MTNNSDGLSNDKMTDIEYHFSSEPCKHSIKSKIDGNWNFLKLNPNKESVRYCHTCGHVQRLVSQ